MVHGVLHHLDFIDLLSKSITGRFSMKSFIIRFFWENLSLIIKIYKTANVNKKGGVAQMVERSLSMREVPGSIPGASNHNFSSFLLVMSKDPQIREQMSVPDLYVVTVAFLALKKTGFSEIKFFSKIFFEKF